MGGKSHGMAKGEVGGGWEEWIPWAAPAGSTTAVVIER
jgi:hypothetical protein